MANNVHVAVASQWHAVPRTDRREVGVFCKRKESLSCNVGTVTSCKNHDAMWAGRLAEIYILNMDL
jgi:hypothetical protein